METSFILKTLPALTLAAQIIFVITLLLYILSEKAKARITQFIKTRALLLAFFVALAGTLGSLFYSEVAGYEPCRLCWYQRIFLYPNVILLGLALYKKDKGIIPYGITLSIVGGAIAFYHYLIQRGIAPELPCSAVGYSTSCAQIFVMSYGYITIPLMALTAFVFILSILILGRESKPRTTG